MRLPAASNTLTALAGIAEVDGASDRRQLPVGADTREQGQVDAIDLDVNECLRAEMLEMHHDAGNGARAGAEFHALRPHADRAAARRGRRAQAERPSQDLQLRRLRG